MPPITDATRTQLFAVIDLKRLHTLARKARHMRRYRKTHPTLNVALNKDQERVLNPCATRVGITLTEYLREAALAYAEKRFLVPRDLEAALHAVTDQLSALGNNLNQIARHANLDGKATAQDVADARALLRRAEQLVERAVRLPPPAP